ncbi:MAG: HEAT repeat domain-containing protein [Candidatus Omnitrophota bacterium]
MKISTIIPVLSAGVMLLPLFTAYSQFTGLEAEAGSQVNRFNSADKEEKIEAIKIIAGMKPDAGDAVNELIALLGDDSEQVAQAAQDVLVKIGKPAVERLTESLFNDNPRLRFRSAWTLGEIGDCRCAEMLTDLLKDTEDIIRYRTAWSLGMLKNPQAAEALISCLDDKNSRVRWRCAWALGRIRHDFRSVTAGDTVKMKNRKGEIIDVPSPESLKGFGEDASKWQVWWQDSKERIMNIYECDKVQQ